MTAIETFTGDASPYGGGDPYADYRTADFPFTHLADLADRRLGAGVIAANDEFFAERENLLLPGRPVFDPERFGHKGKIMDGWETRRRRGASAGHPWPAGDDHDWALIRLGTPGVVRGIVVDTAHFRGNYPQAVSVEGAAVDGFPSPEDLLGDDVKWTTLVPRTPVGGHAANGFAVTAGQRVTHLRLNQHPDGGIARLRVYGEVVPDPAWLTALGTFDVVALEIDTAYLKGNAAGWASVSVRDGEGGEEGDWREILPRTRLQPDTNHRFVLPAPAVGTHARVDIHPDGGISRLRLFGTLTDRGRGELETRRQELGG